MTLKDRLLEYLAALPEGDVETLVRSGELRALLTDVLAQTLLPGDLMLISLDDAVLRDYLTGQFPWRRDGRAAVMTSIVRHAGRDLKGGGPREVKEIVMTREP